MIQQKFRKVLEKILRFILLTITHRTLGTRYFKSCFQVLNCNVKIKLPCMWCEAFSLFHCLCLAAGKAIHLCVGGGHCSPCGAVHSKENGAEPDMSG